MYARRQYEELRKKRTCLSQKKLGYVSYAVTAAELLEQRPRSIGFLAVGFLNDVEYPSFRFADGKSDRSHPRPTRTRHSSPTTTRAGQQETSGI